MGAQQREGHRAPATSPMAAYHSSRLSMKAVTRFSSENHSMGGVLLRDAPADHALMLLHEDQVPRIELKLLIRKYLVVPPNDDVDGAEG